MVLAQFEMYQSQFANKVERFSTLKTQYDASFNALNDKIQMLLKDSQAVAVDTALIKNILDDDTVDSDKLLDVYKRSVLKVSERTELANLTVAAERKIVLENKTLLTGPDLTAAKTAISALVDFSTKVRKRQNELTNLKQEINGLMNTLQLVSLRLEPSKQMLVDKISANWLTLAQKPAEVTAWQDSVAKVLFDGLTYHDLETLDGDYESASIFQKEKFFKYVIFLIVTILVGTLLCLLLFKPDSELLDTFILVLAIILLVYYIYEYYSK